MPSRICAACGYPRPDHEDACPLAVACPSCPRGVGQWCIRPSGHRAPQLHARRVSDEWRSKFMVDPGSLPGQQSLFG